MSTKKEPKPILTLPEGRVINCSLYEKDAYTAPNGVPGKPSYKIELAFDPAQVEGEGTIEDAIIDACVEEWGEQAEQLYLDGKITSPFISGDDLAAKRAEKGKDGDAYKGKTVIRANTSFNKDGVDGPGGITVVGPDTKPITAVEQNRVYPGCYGIAAVTVGCYLDNKGGKGTKFYLSAFQMTRDGERLVKPRDMSKVFEPVARTAVTTEGGRRRRVA